MPIVLQEFACMHVIMHHLFIFAVGSCRRIHGNAVWNLPMKYKTITNGANLRLYTFFIELLNSLEKVSSTNVKFICKTIEQNPNF